ncbi:MAG: ferrochelatase [Candidatus Meridianibacter frigidus]|nr:MAG: ferrochelatase [Candidatus Eremiobacteraeota bacterium]
MNCEAVLLLGFGGPANPQEIRPFLDRVLQARPIPPGRYEEVVNHYMRVGGKSPYNELTQRLAAALELALAKDSLDLPVRVAYRNAAPFIEEVLRNLADSGAKRVAGVVLAPQQSAPVDPYVHVVDRARASLNASAPDVAYTRPYFDHPLFIAAHVARARDALKRLSRSSLEETALIFSAHSIPCAVAARAPYVSQLERSASMIARELGADSWTLAYQSRSGSPKDAWLEPDVRDVLRGLPNAGMREALVIPLGFLCDHVEVLYDLDIDAAGVAAHAGLKMERATALNDHPDFVKMLAELVRSVG